MLRKYCASVQIAFLIGFVTLWHLTRTPLKTWIPTNAWLRIDPLLAAANWLSRGEPNALLWPSLLMLAAALLWGRFFCGWACPVGTILDWETKLLARFGYTGPGRKIKWPRLNLWVAAAALLASASGVALVLGFVDPLVFAHRGLTFVRAGRFPEMLVVVLALGLITPRFWCRYLCPLGGLLGAARLPFTLRRRVLLDCTKCGKCARTCPMGAIHADARETPLDCLRCGTCQAVCPGSQVTFGMGLGARAAKRPAVVEPTQQPGPPRERSGPDPERRHLLLVLASGLAAGLVPSGARAVAPGPTTGAVIRPPGCLSEPKFLESCVRCGECIKVCPTRGLVPALTEAGWQGLWTPHLVPRIGECKRCMLCGRVCPTGALKQIPVSLMKIGTAKLDRAGCWAWNGTRACRVCFERCPKRIIQLDEAGRPTVDEAACDGCGYCEKYCPAKPAAIVISPEGQRRRDQQGGDDATATVREEL